MEAFETDAKKEAWYRKELKYVVNRADVILEVKLTQGLNKYKIIIKSILRSWMHVILMVVDVLN